MSDQQPQPAPAQQANKKELISLITNPQVALCLVEFLKDLSGEKKFPINDEGKILEYDHQTALEALLNWTRLNLPGFSVETVGSIPHLEFFDQLTESIFKSFYKIPEGSVVPENLQELVRVYTAQQIKKPEGINPRDLGKLSVKEMVRLATEIREKIRETANPKFYPEFPEAAQEINEQVFKKAVNHYAETQKPPEAQVLKKIIKEVINKDPAAGLIFAGKTEAKEPRVTAFVRRLEPIVQTPQLKQAANTYQTIQNATDLQCTRTNLAENLQKFGLTPRQTLEFLNHLETLHPDISLPELKAELELFMRAKGFTPEQGKQINSNIRTLKRYLELSPNIFYGDNVFLASSATKKTANWFGFSTKVLSAVGLGLTEERIDQELKRKDLSEAEKNNLRTLKESLKEVREKTKIEDISKYVDKRIKKRGLWQVPEGFYFYRQTPTILEKPAATFFQKLSRPVQAVIRKSFLRGLGTIKFSRMPGLKKLGYFQPSTWKKKAKFWLAKRIVGGLLIASGKNLLGKLGKTIIEKGFREAFFKGLAFVFKKAASYVAQKMAQSVLWRLAAWLLGAIAANVIPGIGQIVSAILVVAGILDFVWSAIKFVKDILGHKPKKLFEGGFDVADAAAGLVGKPLSLLKGLFSPKSYTQELGPALKPAEETLGFMAKAAVVIVVVICFLLVVVFPLSPAFVTLYSAYKVYKGVQNLLASNVEKAKNVASFLKNAGNIALNNLNLFPPETAEASTDEFYNKLLDLGFAEDQARAIIENTKKYGHLQCVILATTLFNTMHPENPIPILASPKEYYPDPPAGFRNVTSVDEIGPGTLVVVPPRKSGCDCQTDIYCCGHMYVILDVEGNEIVTAHAEGSTGEVYIKNLPNPKILSDVDLNKYIIPE